MQDGRKNGHFIQEIGQLRLEIGRTLQPLRTRLNTVAYSAARFPALARMDPPFSSIFSLVWTISLRGEQNYERGIRRLPAEVLLTLAKVYGIDPLWVLDGPGEQPRRLDYTGGLDQKRLARAMQVVMAAVEDSGKTISGDQIADWVAAVYRFYTENASGTGAEALVKTLIGAKR